MILEAEIINDEILEAELLAEVIQTGGKTVQIGNGLKLEDNVLSVDTDELRISVANQAVLDKISEDENGNLFFGEERIASVPAGGTEGQVLIKQSDTDYDYGWKNSVTLEYNSGVLSIF